MPSMLSNPGLNKLSSTAEANDDHFHIQTIEKCSIFRLNVDNVGEHRGQFTLFRFSSLIQSRSQQNKRLCYGAKQEF
jgi:hypothetical protein